MDDVRNTIIEGYKEITDREEELNDLLPFR